MANKRKANKDADNEKTILISPRQVKFVLTESEAKYVASMSEGSFCIIPRVRVVATISQKKEKGDSNEPPLAESELVHDCNVFARLLQKQRGTLVDKLNELANYADQLTQTEKTLSAVQEQTRLVLLGGGTSPAGTASNDIPMSPDELEIINGCNVFEDRLKEQQAALVDKIKDREKYDRLLAQNGDTLREVQKQKELFGGEKMEDS